MSEWAFRITRDQIDRLSSGQQVWNAQAAVVDDHIWIRGGKLDDDLQRELATLSDEPVFVIDGGRLIPVGCVVPVGRLPDTNWTALRELIRLSLPVAAIPSGRISRAELTLQRVGPERTANLQMIEWSVWRAWAETAAEDRLEKLRFVAVIAGELPLSDASSADSLAIVRGDRLPGLPGLQFSLRDRIGRPMGYDVRPQLDSESLLKMLDAEHEGDPADYLLLPAGRVSSTTFSVVAIGHDSWLAARRANVRATDVEIGRS